MHIRTIFVPRWPQLCVDVRVDSCDRLRPDHPQSAAKSGTERRVCKEVFNSTESIADKHSRDGQAAANSSRARARRVRQRFARYDGRCLTHLVALLGHPQHQRLALLHSGSQQLYIHGIPDTWPIPVQTLPLATRCSLHF